MVGVGDNDVNMWINLVERHGFSAEVDLIKNNV